LKTQDPKVVLDILKQMNCENVGHECSFLHKSITDTRGANSSSFRGSNFHEISFKDVIVLIQPQYNFFVNGQR